MWVWHRRCTSTPALSAYFHNHRSGHPEPFGFAQDKFRDGSRTARPVLSVGEGFFAPLRLTTWMATGFCNRHLLCGVRKEREYEIFSLERRCLGNDSCRGAHGGLLC